MKIIKFRMKRIKENHKSIKTSEIKNWFEFQTVGVFKYRSLKKDGWDLISIHIFILTDIYLFIKNIFQSWSRLSTSNKIAIIGIAIAIVVSVTLFILDKFILIN